MERICREQAEAIRTDNQPRLTMLIALGEALESRNAMSHEDDDEEPGQQIGEAVWGGGLDYGVAPNATDDEEDMESTHSSVDWYNEDVGDVESSGPNSQYERDGTWDPERDS